MATTMPDLKRILKLFDSVCVCVIVIVCCGVARGVSSVGSDDEGSDCFVKWVHGYRLASGRPQKILHSVSLEICKQECASTVGCAAFAYGTTNQNASSSICELAINSRLRSSTSRQKSPDARNIFSSGQSSTRFFNFPSRDGRSITTQSPDQNATASSGAPTITIQDLDRNPIYDVYIENPNSNEPCYKRDALYESGYPINNQIGGGGGGGGFGHHHFGQSQNAVPIDCFYRLMSGKRLVKTHTLRAISVNSLQECQDACIHERSFNCRSISYRYMPSSGYSYPVSNCEMSSYYMQSGTISSSYSKLDFVEDYDYDFFLRETHCKTTGSTTLGVCAVVVRRGGRVSTTLIKSSHNTVTSSQCEHLCVTSLFRCRAFAFRHTTRGRDPYVSSQSRYPSPSPLAPTRDIPPPADHTCLLYDTDLMRLPSYNIEPDHDFDLFEMGRLMGAECVLYEQFLNRRPGFYSPGPVTSTVAYPPENREYFGGGGGGSYHQGHHQVHHTAHHQHGMGSSSRERDRVDQHPHGTGHNYLINRENERDREVYGGGSSGMSHHHGPPSTLETGLMIGGDRGHMFSGDHRGGVSEFERPGVREEGRVRPVESHSFQNVSGSGGSGHSEPPYYDKGKESCLRVFRQDAYLIPEVSRATFPVKTVDECRVECIRSLEVLRFPCRAMAFRHTSHSSIDRVPGGSCQLSDNEPREPDLVVSRDRYEGAVTFIFDEREPGCRTVGGVGGGSAYDRDRYNRYDDRDRDRNTGYVDYYNQNRNNYNPPYHNTAYDRHYSYDRQSASSYYPASNRYYEQNRNDYNRAPANDYNRAPANYNPHYWDYHNSGSSGGNRRYGDSYDRNRYYGQATNNEYSEYRNGQGGTTVNGERCMRSCRQNRDAGFYYCQIDEQGAWDFCCRPDHFCGYSKGLSVPWCYVGTGPSQNIWRSCEAKGSRNNPFFAQPNVAYLHDRLPPTVYSLTNTQVANLTKDNAIRLFTNSTMNGSPIEEVGNSGEKQGNFVAKPVQGSQEVIVRVSNSTGGEGGGKKEGGSKGKS